jgi:hypothetical protein
MWAEASSFVQGLLSPELEAETVDVGHYRQFFSTHIRSPIPISGNLAMDFKQKIIQNKSMVILGYEVECSVVFQELSALWGEKIVCLSPGQPLDELKPLSSNELLLVPSLMKLSEEQLRWLEGYLIQGGSLFLYSEPVFWKTLSTYSSLPQLVSEVVQLKGLEFESFCRILLHRHNLSGYTMEYLAENLPLKILQQRASQERWFSWLYRRSKGSIEEAIELWLLSIVRVDQRSIILSSEVCEQRLHQEMVCERAAWLVARQCFRYGWCSIERGERWFGLEGATAEAFFRRLTQDGILEEERMNGEQRWSLSSELRPQFRRALEQRSWL